MDYFDVLSVNGVPPRRAVLADNGSLAQKQRPAENEVPLLSRLCELARASRNIECPPRSTAALMERALMTNSPTCWTAAADDITTGDFDAPAVVSLLSQNQSYAVAFATCFASPVDASHMMAMLRVFHKLDLPDETTETFGRTIGCQLKTLIDALASHAGLIKKDIREAVMNDVGKMLAMSGVPTNQLADALRVVLATKKYDALRLFLHADIAACFRACPDALAGLVEKAKNVGVHHRSIVLAVIAKVIRDDPDAVPPAAIRDMLGAVLKTPSEDARALLAIAIASQVACSEDAITKGLADALEWTCGHVISFVTTSR
jgi:hypothetical protein